MEETGGEDNEEGRARASLIPYVRERKKKGKTTAELSWLLL
jgi:hypothetical protein